jgi:hypothetical protein
VPSSFFDFAKWHDHQKRLRLGDHAACGMHRQLLNGASHRRGEHGEPLALARLGLLLRRLHPPALGL